MSNAVKAGLSFGIFMGIFYIAIDWAMYRHEEGLGSIVLRGALGGLIAGLLFGWFTGMFSKKIEKSLEPDLEDGEAVIFKSNACHFKGIEAVGGRLFLTSKRLLFKSHRFNIQNHVYSVSLTDIKKTETYRTLGIRENGLKIITATANERFVVDQRDAWIAHLDRYNIAAAGAL